MWCSGLWILLQIFSQVGTPAGEASGVAYMAHIGGFVAGLVLVMVMGKEGGGKGRSVDMGGGEGMIGGS